MKVLWCWRCKMEVPMLDEEEYSSVYQLYGRGFYADEKFRREFELTQDNRSINDRFRPMREKYMEITGFSESNHNAIMHHRISDYGDPCENCGKPLRTPKASFCAACGQKKEN